MSYANVAVATMALGEKSPAENEYGYSCCSRERSL